MPFKSKAQQRKFGQLLKEGKITKEKFDEWAKDTPDIKKLPEKVGEKKIKVRSIDDIRKIAKVKLK